MGDNKTGLEKTLLLATSIVGGIVALFTALNGLFDRVKETSKVLSGFNEWQLGLAALALAAFSLWLFRLSRRRRSVLLRPEALRLERENPAHLAGRADDVAQLTRLCREESLVFLEGESGAGKSALLQAGLVPMLNGDAELLPIYIESLAGADWERDPRRFLAAALWMALDEAARGALELKAPPGPDAACSLIASIPQKLGRMPLVILDQFDDYQLRHHARFLLRKTWLRPGKLSEQNGFWRDIRELLASGRIHLVVVTRTDTAAGLASVRFTEPETYRLDRLSSHFVGPLLAELAKDQDGQPVVSDPDSGWETLVARLSADLERAGTVLPQQLKIVLGGLGTLPRRILTVTAYERAGGTSGLEAGFIEHRLTRAAQRAGIGEERVRTALLALVDPVTGQKTVERRTTELAACIDAADPERAQPVLDQLALDEVIRRRIDPGTSETSWLLDHDYLARAVREADRRANRWQRALADGAKTLAGAGDSWPRSWRALLPPTTQLRFLWDRLRGRFRYGEHRRYAAKSLQRFAPIMVILLSVAAAGWEWGRVRAEERLARSAEDILNGLEFEQGKVAESDAKALLRLASAANEVRQHALMLVLTNQDRARVFVREPEMVVRAIAGVSPQFRDWAKLCLRSVAGLSASRPETTVAASKAALLLGRPEALTLHWYLATIESTKDPEALRTVAEALKVFAATLDDGRAKDAAGPFLAAIKSTSDPNALEALAEGLGALPVKLSDRQAKEAIEPFLDALKETGIKPPAFKALAEGLKALPVKPDDSQTRELVKQFLAITKGGASGSDLKALGAGLKAFTTTLSESQASDAVAPLLTAMQSTENPSELQVLAEGLGALPAKLTDSQAQEAVEPFLAAIWGSTNPYTLQTLAEGLSALPVKLSDTQAKEFAEPFVVALSSNTGSLLTRDLGAAVEALPARIEVIKPLLAAMNSNTDPFSQYALGSGMRGIAKLGEDQAMELVEPFLTAIEASINKGIANHIALEGLVAAFGALPARLDDRQAQETIRLFVRESQQASHPSTLPVELKVMPAKLDANQARAAVAPLLSAIRDATDPSTLWALAAGIGALPTALSDSEVTKAVEPLLATIRDATDPSTLWALGAGLGALPGKLSDGQARVAVEPFLAAFERTSEASVLFALGAGLDAFAVKLDRRSAAAAKIAVNQAFKSTLDQQTFALYARLSVKLAKGEPADQQAGSIFHLLRHPLSAGDPAPNLFVPLEQVPGVQTKFGGDLWKAVEWAEAEQKAGRLKNLELDAPLQIN